MGFSTSVGEIMVSKWCQKGIGGQPRIAVQQNCDPDHEIAANYRNCDLELLECNGHVTLTMRLLPATEVVTLNYWSATEM